MRVIFVHGAFVRDGAWWWQPVASLLEQSGVASTAVALPSCGEGSGAAGGFGLADDAAALRAAIAADPEPAIVVAHSYGGIVTAEGGAGAAHLLYLSSFLPRVGETIAEQSASPDPVPVEPQDDGTVSVLVTDAFDRRFLHDVADPELVRGARERLAPQSGAVFGTPVTAAAWQQVPSTYLVCAEDRSTLPALQREQATRAGAVVELPTGHHPMLSRPDLVAAAVTALRSTGH
ncbi:MAG TPA: alpha/beta hydrolase [Jatrophihabitans sp.]|jgi:pimeloyl-ACP methyl ester carboxylesterase|uniref:alpha/beta hydrolase n=1 Tax=Jatrophihabitans sp. TaxID=1932789 RepID=UPI002E0CF528|nr:alpha/beta hydrolase [Jatrophihabitans sp.]